MTPSPALADYDEPSDPIAAACQTSAIFDHCEAMIGNAPPPANEDPLDQYDNLYLIPAG